MKNRSSRKSFIFYIIVFVLTLYLPPYVYAMQETDDVRTVIIRLKTSNLNSAPDLIDKKLENGTWITSSSEPSYLFNVKDPRKVKGSLTYRLTRVSHTYDADFTLTWEHDSNGTSTSAYQSGVKSSKFSVQPTQRGHLGGKTYFLEYEIKKDPW